MEPSVASWSRSLWASGASAECFSLVPLQCHGSGFTLTLLVAGEHAAYLASTGTQSTPRELDSASQTVADALDGSNHTFAQRSDGIAECINDAFYTASNCAAECGDCALGIRGRALSFAVGDLAFNGSPASERISSRTLEGSDFWF